MENKLPIPPASSELPAWDELYERSKLDHSIIVGSEVRQVIGHLRAAQGEVKRLREQEAKEERDQLQLIVQRDAAEEALSQAYFLITGRSPEWSNLFGHDEALEEIDAAQQTLRKSLTTHPQLSDEVRGKLVMAHNLIYDRPLQAWSILDSILSPDTKGEGKL